MKPVLVICAFACASLALAVPSQAAINVGLVDDGPAVTLDGGAAFFTLMNDVGLREVRLTLKWDPAQPTAIAHQTTIASMLPVAAVRGMRVVFSVQPDKAKSITDTPDGAGQFADYLQLL